MALRSILKRGLPQPPEDGESLSLTDQILQHPLMIPVRLYWANLKAMEAWWPILIPVLLWVAYRRYAEERRELEGRL